MRENQERFSEKNTQGETMRRLTYAGVFAAVTFVAFTFLSIPIPTIGGSKVTVHVGNAFCVLGTLLLGTLYGSLGGAVGLTLADLFDPLYITQAPITFLIKLLMGLIVGGIAHKGFRLSHLHDRGAVLRAVAVASTAGLLFNALFDPLLRYFYKILILGKPAAEVSFAINFAVTAINSVVSLLLVVVLYVALVGPLKKMGLDFEN